MCKKRCANACIQLPDINKYYSQPCAESQLKEKISPFRWKLSDSELAVRDEAVPRVAVNGVSVNLHEEILLFNRYLYVFKCLNFG